MDELDSDHKMKQIGNLHEIESGKLIVTADPCCKLGEIYPICNENMCFTQEVQVEISYAIQ